ncbi:MAG: Aminocarboxymuconate-semialdehyde decarboxylase [Conexibacter sp.]|nr:Aminocarboxymuconate-semialdehyde decarboxylase [Conexibacter sp.]
MVVIDTHTHFQPRAVLDVVAPFGITMTERADGRYLFRSGDLEYVIPGSPNAFWGDGLADRVAQMDAAGVDIQVLQPSPLVFNLHLPAAVNARFSRAFNEQTAALIAAFPERFWGSAHLPVQDPVLAAAELEHAVTQLGFRSCTIDFVTGGGRTLAAPEYEPLLAAAQALDVPIQLHPVPLGQTMDLVAAGAPWLAEHQTDWAWGYLFGETVAVAGLILGGVLDRFPALRFSVPHGGGMIPYHLGRLERHAEIIGGVTRPIAEYLPSFFFDTVVHDPRALVFLIQMMGDQQVVLGTNHPGWDDFPGWDVVRGLPGISDEAKARILGQNAATRLFASQHVTTHDQT